MPLYRYRCHVCHKQQDLFRPVSEYANMPECCGKPTSQVITAPYVMPDIGEYRAVAADKETGRRPVIKGRADHRKFLKRNGYEELGNEMPKSTNRTDDRTTAVADDIAREISAKWRGG